MDSLLRSLIKTVRRRLRADEEVTVEAVTKELGYTRQYISGRFHRITGRLLSHFLKEKRLEKAARLLESGNLRVSQIARRCGFDSENYFRQQFRRALRDVAATVPRWKCARVRTPVPAASQDQPWLRADLS